MGLVFFGLVGSNKGFLSMEVISACFIGEEKIPVDKERLKMRVGECIRKQEGDQSSCGGLRSKVQVLMWMSEKSLALSSVVKWSNKESIERSW